ncbi:hypothetical protein [Sulfitobacter mediterraneus]|jgi:hypothetical protein|nr:hypothetical protein [Sulfitobacter mediterraneus]
MNLGYSIGVALLVAVTLIALLIALFDAERPLGGDTADEISNEK